MKSFYDRRGYNRVDARAALLVAAMLLLLLCACGGSRGGESVVVVTATNTQEQIPQVIEVTATFTLAPLTDTATVTPALPTPDMEATVQAALAATLTAAPTNTDTPRPPTDTPRPPTDTPRPPTDTPRPPTDTPRPAPTNTRRPRPTNTVVSYPPPVLLSPDVDFNCYNIGGCLFTWSFGGTLAQNHYFQVQLVGPQNEHRGIHPPTKGYSFQSNWSVYQIITDWCDPSKFCHMQWTVAVVEWDGVDPSKIGRTIVETTPPRWIWL